MVFGVNKNSMINIIEKLFSLPKSIYVSFRLFPISEAIRIPCFVRYNTQLISLKGLIKVKTGGVKLGMIQIGFGHVGIFDIKNERAIIQLIGVLEVEGPITIGQGGRICVTKNGLLKIGENFSNTAMGTIVCNKEITIGRNVALSWNTLIMDTDWHDTINVVSGQINSKDAPIFIGDNVWIGTRAVILKRSIIGNGCIVGANAIVSGKFISENACIVGNPARIIKENITKYNG